MATVALNETTFNDTIESNDIVLIDFWAEWCGPCRTFGPVFEKASEEHGDIVFAKVDTEAEPGLAQAFSITSIPTLMAIRDKVVLYAQPGALPAPQLAELIGQVKGLDMDQVHADIAKQSEQNGAGEA